MKRTVFLLLIAFISLNAFSQNNPSVLGWKITRDIPANELKVNLPTTVFLLYPEISYERILNSDMSLGVSAGVGLGSDEYPLDFNITPYVRWFFGGNSKSLERYGAGFFIELNGSVFATETNSYDYNTNSYNYNSSDFGAGLGMGIGWKYFTRNNWIGEILLGFGRDFVNDGAYPRLGVSIGKRF